jgi:hypothetical protein
MQEIKENIHFVLPVQIGRTEECAYDGVVESMGGFGVAMERVIEV